MDYNSCEDLDYFISQVNLMYADELESYQPVFIAMASLHAHEVIDEVQKTKVNYFV